MPKDEFVGSGSVADSVKRLIPCVVTTGGEVMRCAPANGNDFDLDEMQGIVGGHIEVMPLEDSLYMVLNEEGKLIGLPHNPIATAVLNNMSQASPDDFIAGDVLICRQAQVL